MSQQRKNVISIQSPSSGIATQIQFSSREIKCMEAGMDVVYEMLRRLGISSYAVVLSCESEKVATL